MGTGGRLGALGAIGGVLALQLGCRATFDSVDDACPDGLAGDDQLEPGTEDALLRIACYRRFVQLAPGKVTLGIQKAVAAHAAYLEDNGLLSPERIDTLNPWVENGSLTGFTGGNVYDRLYAAEAIDHTADIGVWEVFLPVIDGARAASIDDLFHAFPWARDPMFQPALIGYGYAEARGGDDVYSYMNIVYTFPPNLRFDKPIVFPHDGQLDVPVGYVPFDWPGNPLNVRPGIGYPISITVGSYEGSLASANPYDLQLIEATLLGPDGQPVPLVTGGPGRYGWGDNQATVIIAADQPLRPDSTYELQATLSWNARTNKKVSTVFTTGSSTALQTW
ncbi:MAG: hypothetical protein H6733_11045 [Alphaproteobacteria bacterium]|nr:hypothetical protein [Alphaproteobacteria bacterium]